MSVRTISFNRNTVTRNQFLPYTRDEVFIEGNDSRWLHCNKPIFMLPAQADINIYIYIYIHIEYKIGLRSFTTCARTLSHNVWSVVLLGSNPMCVFTFTHHTGAWTKWSIFCRQHFQRHFFRRKCCNRMVQIFFLVVELIRQHWFTLPWFI